MKVKIDNQELYEARIKYFKEKYIKDFKEKVSVPGCDKSYVRERFKRDLLEPKMNEIFNSKNFKDAQDFSNQKKWFNGLKTFEAIKIFCVERKANKDFQLILQALAENDAILNIYNDLSIDKNENENQNENTFHSIIVENLHNLKDSFNNENDFLQAIKHLETFFTSGNISINKTLFVKNGSIKRLAFALGEIWRKQKNEPITYEYLCLYKKLFSIFKGQHIDKQNIFGCNLYKYSISKT